MMSINTKTYVCSIFKAVLFFIRSLNSTIYSLIKAHLNQHISTWIILHRYCAYIYSKCTYDMRCVVSYTKSISCTLPVENEFLLYSSYMSRFNIVNRYLIQIIFIIFSQTLHKERLQCICTYIIAVQNWFYLSR